MAIELTIMNANQAREYAIAHQLQLDVMEGTASQANIEATLSTIGSVVLGKIFYGTPGGTIAAFASLMITIANNSNVAATRSHLRGARDGFYEIENFLNSSSNYLQAEVEQVWIGLPYPNSPTKFVEGVEANPSQAYRIRRVLLANGQWQ